MVYGKEIQNKKSNKQNVVNSGRWEKGETQREESKSKTLRDRRGDQKEERGFGSGRGPEVRIGERRMKERI